MAKLTLTDPSTNFQSTTQISANNTLIEAAIENTLSRDGTTPNQMQASLDMNGYSIINEATGLDLATGVVNLQVVTTAANLKSYMESASAKTVLVTTAIVMTDDITGNALSHLWVCGLGSITTTGFTFVSNGPITAPSKQIFLGSGTATMSGPGIINAAWTTGTEGYTFNSSITLGADDDLIGSATSDIIWNTDKFTVAGDTGNTSVGGTLGITGILTPSGGIARTKQYTINALAGKSGATTGWTVTGSDTGSAKCPASKTAATLVVPVTIPLAVGWTITAYTVTGQIESAAGAVTLDVDLRKLTAATADLTDASVGAITQVSKTADYTIAETKTGLSEVIAATESFYFLCTATTAGSTDIDLQGFTITVTEI